MAILAKKLGLEYASWYIKCQYTIILVDIYLFSIGWHIHQLHEWSMNNQWRRNWSGCDVIINTKYIICTEHTYHFVFVRVLQPGVEAGEHLYLNKKNHYQDSLILFTQKKWMGTHHFHLLSWSIFFMCSDLASEAKYRDEHVHYNELITQ